MKPDQTAHLANASGSACTDAQWALRVDLAAAFRLAAQFEWTESVGNHFSAVVSSADGTFLMNPRWVHFSLVRASELMLLNWNDTDVLSRPNPPAPTMMIRSQSLGVASAIGGGRLTVTPFPWVTGL